MEFVCLFMCVKTWPFRDWILSLSSVVVGLCSADFINPVGVVAGVWRQRLVLPIGNQLSRFHLKMETKSSL
jgi:hypothetical protein